jgi:hypothetical protein
VRGQCLYNVYFEMHCSRRGFMPGNRIVKYFLKCPVEYIDVGGASSLVTRRVKYYRK